jgi:hypothetical protein
MWEMANQWERVWIVIMIMGATVDILQFLWVIKRGWRSMKEKMYKRIEKDILFRQYKDQVSKPRVKPIENDSPDMTGMLDNKDWKL